MSAQKIDHLGIAVKDLAAATKKFEQLLGVSVGGTEEVLTESVRVVFFQVGESRFELLEPTNESSPIAKFLEKRGEGIHHVCVAVKDVKAEVERLRGLGFEFVGAAPRAGAGGHQVAFIHPRSAGGILVELSEGPGHP